MSLKVLVTGSAGLIGSEAVEFFDRLGCAVDGLDNNMRASFFGPNGDTTWNRQRLEQVCQRYTHHDVDIRDRDAVDARFRAGGYELVIHAAAQPSHDLAASRPFDDFDVNAVGTLNLLEACRRHAPDAVFITVSTNKVYGDNPNRVPLVELDTRYDYADPALEQGIDETMSIEGCLHSLFGASKVAADILTQEYGRYFGLRTGAFRGGCLTGPHHSGVELHGFLSYLVHVALREGEYTIFGYKGKQVRDQIHSADVISAFWAFAQDPRPGEVYNLGGGKANAASLLECVDLIADASGGQRPRLTYDEQARVGDHICYYTDMAKFRTHYPSWTQAHTLDAIVDEMVGAVRTQLSRDEAAAVRLTLLNQFYAPDISPTAQLAASLTEHRAALGDEVTVIAGKAGYLEGLSHEPAPTPPPTLRVRRAWTPSVGRASVPRRLVGYVSYLVGTTVRVLLLPRQDVIVAMTTPPFTIAIALLHKVLHPSTRLVLWSMDCYPDAAERFGKLRPGGLLSRVLRRTNRFAFRRLDHLVCLDGAMADLLQSQYSATPDHPQTSVIPNWERAALFPPDVVARPWTGYDELDVAGRSIVLYLGNMGTGHRFDTVLEAAGHLTDDAVFVFIGGGPRRDDLQAAATQRGLSNVRFHPYVAKEDTPSAMAGAAGALITLDDRSLGIMSPSKLHANLAAGLPILYVGPRGSNVDEAIERFGCGSSLREGDVAGLVAAVRGLRGDDAIRRRARQAFDEAYCDTAVLPQLDAVLDGSTRTAS